jgi:hypothetical protein
MSGSHGHTPAAWTAVAIIFLGSLISAVALPLAMPWLFFVGLGVIALGAIVGKVMAMMGLGNTLAYQDDRDPDYDGRPGTPSTGPGDAADERSA